MELILISTQHILSGNHQYIIDNSKERTTELENKIKELNKSVNIIDEFFNGNNRTCKMVGDYEKTKSIKLYK